MTSTPAASVTGECPVRFENKGNGFFQVRPGFVKGCPLCVGSRQFLDVRNVIRRVLAETQQ